ncbi:MAG: LTA synthase family protein [Chloroflexi bacterium]|nr:LTA synthase family protein [Chloroflexota bacterium]
MKILRTLIKNRALAVHPFLLTLFPVLSLYANNLGQVPFAEVYRSLWVGLAGTGVLLGLLRLLFGDWHRAAMLTSLASLLFFSYGHVYRLLEGIAGSLADVLLVVWGILFLAGFWFLARAEIRRPDSITRALNLTGGIALLTCLYGFAAYGVQAVVLPEGGADALAEAPPGGIAGLDIAPPPDIYYIILDGYGRSDVLQEIYGVDNAELLAYLEEQGFYIAGESHSNYAQTALSLSSSLNLNYLDQVMELVPETNNRAPLTGLINQKGVQRFLKEQGYQTVAFSNGYAVTEMKDADLFLDGDGESLNNFEMSLLSTSLGGVELTGQIAADYRERILWMAGELENTASLPGPKFVFAHFILPHAPFVFNADGSPRDSLGSGDGSHYSGTTDEYVQGYREQVRFTDRLVREMIAGILANSSREPVIIVQGDHGPGSRLDWDSLENTCVRERFAILNAYYFPGRQWQELYPQISPVNSFRAVFNTYFDAGFERLPDRSYFSLWKRPYDLVDVTDQTGLACPVGAPAADPDRR